MEAISWWQRDGLGWWRCRTSSAVAPGTGNVDALNMPRASDGCSLGKGWGHTWQSNCSDCYSSSQISCHLVDANGSWDISIPCCFRKAQAKKLKPKFFLRIFLVSVRLILVGHWWSWSGAKKSIILPLQVFGFVATIVFAIDFYITFNDLVAFLKQGSSESPEERKSEGR